MKNCAWCKREAILKINTPEETFYSCSIHAQGYPVKDIEGYLGGEE